MYCKECGTENQDDSLKCTSCGEKVSDEILKKIESKKPISQAKVWIFKIIAFVIALFIFIIARAFFAAISHTDKITVVGILLFIGIYILLKGLFLKDRVSIVRGSWILGIYIISSIALTYFYNNSTYGIDTQLREMSYKTPIQVDEDTELSKIIVNDNNITFEYKLINIAKDDISFANLQNFEQIMKDGSCKDKDYLRIIKQNKTIDLYYYGKYNNLIGNIKISNSICR